MFENYNTMIWFGKEITIPAIWHHDKQVAEASILFFEDKSGEQPKHVLKLPLLS
jgi:hypothetical protein